VAKPRNIRRIAEGMDHRNETNMTTTLDKRPGLGSRSFRKFGRGLMTKTRSKHSRKRLFVAISAFEILDFPVRVRLVESPGNKLCPATVRV
jgi:hypothetical protein